MDEWAIGEEFSTTIAHLLMKSNDCDRYKLITPELRKSEEINFLQVHYGELYIFVDENNKILTFY